MQTGTKISLGAHLVLIGLAIFGGPLFEPDEATPMRISEVSLVTSAEFDGMVSRAPQPALQQPEAPAALPDGGEVAPEVPQAEAAPAVPAPAPQAPPEAPATLAEASPEAPAPPAPTGPAPVEAPELADASREATGAELVIPDAARAPEESLGTRRPQELALARPQPRPAPRIDTEPAPKPPAEAETAQESNPASAPDAAAPTPAPEREATAPPEATTQIVPDPEPQTAAPLRSTRPKGRPADLAQRALAARAPAQSSGPSAPEPETNAPAAPAEQAEDAARRAAEAAAIEAALKAAAAQQSAATQGPPLTGAEKGALVLAVQKCWNVPVGVRDAGELVVTLRVELTPEGRVASNPELIEPAGRAEGLVQQAYEAGRRALLRCQPYDLPREKYEQWKTLEVVFNPRQMVLR